MDIFNGKTDLFGYYQVGNQKFYNKFDAVKSHEKTGIHPEWIFNDAVFSCYDWTKEPNESLAELYRRRAEQLREKYDYIILFFSGGADSTNVLQSFINNNIHLDEIATYCYFEGEKNHRDKELIDVAIPYARKVLDAHPEIVHRVFDQSKDLYNLFSNGDLTEQYFYTQAGQVGPGNSRNHIYFYKTFYKDLLDAGEKICFLFGSDKPRVFQDKDTNKWYFRFIDCIDANIKPNHNIPAELFYWSPDLPELLFKLAHIIKRYLENSTEISPFVSTENSQLACKNFGNKTLWLNTHGVHSLIYPNWDINTFTYGKNFGGPVWSKRFSWFYNLGETDTALKNWNQTLQKRWTMIPDYWKNDINNIRKSIKGCWSRNYYLN